MNERMSEMLRAIARPTLYFGVLLVVLPMADFATNVWPYRVGDVQWRFGLVGLLSGFTLTPLLGFFVILLATELLDLPVTQRVVAALGIAAGAALVLAQPLFVLDWLQVRAGAPEEARGSMDIGSIKSIAKHLAVVVSLVWLGVLAWRRAKRDPGARGRRHTTPIVRADLGAD